MAAKGPEYKGIHDALWEGWQKAARKITWQDGGLRQIPPKATHRDREMPAKRCM
jgi:hypothetical protein